MSLSDEDLDRIEASARYAGPGALTRDLLALVAEVRRLRLAEKVAVLSADLQADLERRASAIRAGLPDPGSRGDVIQGVLTGSDRSVTITRLWTGSPEQRAEYDRLQAEVKANIAPRTDAERGTHG